MKFNSITVQKKARSIRSLTNFFSFLLIITPVFFVLSCSVGSWQSTLTSGVLLFTLSSFGVGCRKILHSESLAQLLLRYLFSANHSSCNTPRDFTSGFDLSSNLAVAGDGFKVTGTYYDYVEGPVQDGAGYSVDSAGDVNGDGYDDIIIGAPRNVLSNSLFSSGKAYVIFGKPEPGNINLSTNPLSSGDGFSIFSSIDNSRYTGRVVRGAGDFNHDGFDDLLVGNTYSGPGIYGQVTVVFGKASGFTNVDSTAPGSDGIQITSTDVQPGSTTSHLGFSGTTDGIGDFNGDGIDDIVLGVSLGIYNAGTMGGAFIIFGNETPRDINVSYSFASGANGLMITGTGGWSVAGAGDFNGDELNDVIIGAPNSRTDGRAYIVFGQSGIPSTSISLADIEAGDITEGVFIYSSAQPYYLGSSVSGIGDINGDGFDDVIIGSYGFEDRATVIYGTDSKAKINASLFSSTGGGFVITHNVSGSSTALGMFESVHGAGDINGDGTPDILLGSHTANSDASSHITMGEGTLLFGNNSGMTDTELSAVGDPNGFAVKIGGNPASYSYYYLGQSVSAAGDVNGDGCDDIILGAPGYSNTSGSAWVIFGGVQSQD